ncbi:P-loop containing nucleoside triphosphate hydrolase protein, partial [Cristinia sonorae]
MSEASSSEGGWSSSTGQALLKELLTRLLPQWPDGPRDWQLESTGYILDGHDQLLVAGCGEGKTAATYLHLLVLQELSRNPELPRHGKKIPPKPVTLLVSPLNDVSLCQVEELKRIGLSAISLDADEVAAAVSNGDALFKAVAECRYSVVIVSPERLTSPGFDRVIRNEVFRANLVLYAIDEVHVVVPWSLEFRKCYGDICRAKARIPSTTAMLAMTATAQSGLSESSLLRILGYRVGTFKTIRRPCERTNLQQVFLTLSHGLGGHEFRDIAWVVPARRKTVIYCDTIEFCHRVALYLRQLLPKDAPRTENIKEYHSLITPEQNRRTLFQFSHSPNTFIIIATIKFSLGVDVRNVQFCINLGLPKTIEQDVQQKGRAGRDRSIDAVGITYVEKNIVQHFRK